jgi:hypothetical protein
MNSSSSNKIWIIEHSTGIFLRWRNYLFFRRPRFSWLYQDEEGYCFNSLQEAQENLTEVRRTHPRAYLVELRVSPGLPFRR